MPSLRGLCLSLAALAAMAPACLAQSGSFGNSVVIDGDALMIAEPNNSFRSGLVYIYRKSGADWVESDHLRAPDSERADGFGAALALSGNTLFVAQRGGRIHTFERARNAWTFSGTLAEDERVGLDPNCNNYGYCGTDFGITLAAGDDWLLVGEPRVATDVSRLRARRRRGNENAPPPRAGTVYAFQRDADGRWMERQRIESPLSASGDAFGAAIVLVGDRALIGAPKASRGDEGSDGAVAEAVQGAGRVFEYRLVDGRWIEESEVTVTPEVNAAFGATIVARGGRAVIGAPGADAGFGAAFVFDRAASGVWSEGTRLTAPNALDDDVFGAAVALAGEDVWVGAPVRRGIETGMAFLFPNASDAATARRIRYAEGETNTEDSFGHRIVSSGGIAAITAAGMDHQAGGVFVFERDARGRWQESELLVSPPDALGAVLGEERRCFEGAVELFECKDVELYAFIPTSLLTAPENARGIRTNDNWGWTDSQTGREYALVGRNDGTSFIDITDPANPMLVGDLPKTPETPRSQLWRDIKTYENYAYIVADGAGAHGMQVFDLTRLRDVVDAPVIFQPDLLYRGDGLNRVESIHNIIISEETGFAYLTSRGCAGMHIVDIREPMNPTFVGCSEPGGTHDAQCIVYQGIDERYRGREICLRMSGDRFQISDLTDKANPVELSTASHPNPAYMHQGWVTEDHQYFIMDDESDVIAGTVNTTRTLIWDLTNLEDPVLAKEFMGSMTASAHNLYVKGDFTYQANYRYGLHILDTSDPLNPMEVGFFDTSPYQTGPGFSGAWSTYPFFDSGAVIVTSVQEGLFVLKKRTRPIS